MVYGPYLCRCIPPPGRAGNKSWRRIGGDARPGRTLPATAAGQVSLPGSLRRALALNVAHGAAKIGLKLARRFIRPSKLFGMGVALMLDQGRLADPGIGLP